MKGPVIASGLFHLFIFILTMISIPFIAKDPVVVTPVSIELVQVDEKTQTDIQSPPKEKPKEIEAPKPPESKPTPPQMTEEKPPDLSKPAPPEPIQEVKEETPKPEKKKPEPEPKTQVKEKKKDFQSLLKNLAPDASESREETPDETQEDASNDGNLARLSDKLTMSELDAFRHQLEPCWNIPTGAKYAENLAVEIRVVMNRDMTVNQASVLDKGRYNRDTAFRAAADSAMRALKNPRCSPFKLPPEKYDQWKTIVINFDPQSVL